MQTCFKLIGAKLGTDWTSAPQVTVKLFMLQKYNGRLFVHNSIRTQHLHVVASSIAKLRDDAFISAATADTCSIVDLVKLVMKLHLLTLL